MSYYDIYYYSSSLTPDLTTIGRIPYKTASGIFVNSPLYYDITNDKVVSEKPFEVNSSIIYTPTIVNSSTYSIIISDKTIFVDYTVTGLVTITIPSDQIIAGRELVIIDSGGNAGTNNITIETEGSETINGNSNLVISVDQQSITLNVKNTTSIYIS